MGLAYGRPGRYLPVHPAPAQRTAGLSGIARVEIINQINRGAALITSREKREQQGLHKEG